jgi:hypothetical protein
VAVSRLRVASMGRWSALGGCLLGCMSHCIIASIRKEETKRLSGRVQFFVRACSSVGMSFGRASERSNVDKISRRGWARQSACGVKR